MFTGEQMTGDSIPLPPWSEIERAVEQAAKTRDEKTREESAVVRLRWLGGSMMLLGFATSLVLLASSLADPGMEHTREAINPLALTMGVAGVVLMAVSLLSAANRGRHEAIMAKLAKIEERARRHHRSDDSADGAPRDEAWQRDVAEAYRLGQHNPHHDPPSMA